MTERVGLKRDADGIAVLWLKDEAQRNALTHELVGELSQRLAELGADPEAKVCVVRGLPEVFCAGADQSLLLELAEGRMAASDIVLSRLLLDLPIPSVAAVEGHAVGGGLALALCCDVLVLARESRYGCSFMNLGFTPGMGITRLLPEAVGHHLAAEMLFGGQMLKGAELAGRGSVNHVVPRAEVLPRAMKIAARMAEKPRHALELLKRHLSVGRRQAFEEARTSEAAMHQICFARPETAQLIRDEYVRPAAEGRAEKQPAPRRADHDA